jgi:DMSO/TMAO reductase YedYZ molybdopterin-dependent catalytic subunit
MKASRVVRRVPDERAAAILGVSLGVTFTVCFVTGVMSHLAYDQPSWWPIGPRPAGLYRVTQGVHVATGIATIPLLLTKLWVVAPRLFTWPPFESVAHAVERISLVPLVGGSLFLLFSGVGNVAGWRPWGFFFTDGHYHAAWITIGALVVHIGAKASVTARALRRHVGREPATAPVVPGALSRRQLLGTAGTASVVLTVATVGQTVRPFAGVSVLAPRDPRVGPQGVPVNRSAAGAGVLDELRTPGFEERYRLTVARAGVVLASLSMAELRALRSTDAALPIACVEGWSAEARWRGVAVRDLLASLTGGAGDDVGTVDVVSMQTRGRFRESRLTREWLRDPHTLLAYDLNGAPLADDHGAPVRLIAPNRPGVMQTKWVQRLELA